MNICFLSSTESLFLDLIQLNLWIAVIESNKDQYQIELMRISNSVFLSTTGECQKSETRYKIRRTTLKRSYHDIFRVACINRQYNEDSKRQVFNQQLTISPDFENPPTRCNLRFCKYSQVLRIQESGWDWSTMWAKNRFVAALLWNPRWTIHELPINADHKKLRVS